MIYPIIIIPIITGCVVQSIKFALSVVKHKKIEFKYLFGPGHMPSAHTAFVVSLITTVAYYDSIFSTTFAISLVLAYIVIYDALKIRTNIGYNGQVVNKLIRELPDIARENYPVLKERVGHKLSEVFVGAGLGFVITILLIVLFENL
jgi:hypothetical protein